MSAAKPNRKRVSRAVRAAPKKAKPTVDPIFAVIAEHRAAQEDVLASCRATDLDVDDDPNKVRAMGRASKAERPLFTTAPTTIAGIVALLEYVGSDVHESNRERDDNGRLKTVLAFAQGWSGKTAVAAYRFPRHVAAALRKIAGARS
jgi:hypothetical protein